MSREPQPRDRRYRTSFGAPVDLTAEVESPYGPLRAEAWWRRGPQPQPHARHRRACHDTRKVLPAFTDELRSGPEVGPRDNLKTRQEAGNAVTEYRHGQATRPPRPGAGADVGTTERAVTLPTEKGNADQSPAGGPESPGRGVRADGTAEVPDRQLDIRDR